MDVFCILAALLFWLSNLLKLIYLGVERKHEGRPQWMDYTSLDPEAIQKEWQFKIDNRSHLVATSVLSMLAWFLLSIPLLQLAYALNKQKGPGVSKSVWLHTGIVVMALGGALTEWIGNFLYLGTTLAMETMVRGFNLDTWIHGQEVNDELGWRSLELTAFALRGMVVWIDAFEWISLFFLMIFIFVAVERYRRIDPTIFGAGWNGVGLFLGLLCLLEFITELLRLFSWRVFSRMALVYGSLNRLILLPFWLIVLGLRLPHALRKYEEKDTTVEPPVVLGPGAEAL